MTVIVIGNEKMTLECEDYDNVITRDLYIYFKSKRQKQKFESLIRNNIHNYKGTVFVNDSMYFKCYYYQVTERDLEAKLHLDKTYN